MWRLSDNYSQIEDWVIIIFSIKLSDNYSQCEVWVMIALSIMFECSQTEVWVIIILSVKCEVRVINIQGKFEWLLFSAWFLSDESSECKFEWWLFSIIWWLSDECSQYEVWVIVVLSIKSDLWLFIVSFLSDKCS